MSKYVIGIDFGTLSARAILVDAISGKEQATCEYEYPHGVMDNTNFGLDEDGKNAFQHPKDYVDALKNCINGVLIASSISAKQIYGVGIDFTSCTLLPVDEKGIPLCYMDEFKNNPQAYAKLWKHHGPESQAEKMTKIAVDRKEKWLSRYGGKISSEEAFPKIYETLEKSPIVYESADNFLEGADYIIKLLTGKTVRSNCFVGFKNLWDEKGGYPSKEYFNAVDSRLKDVVEHKVKGEIIKIGKVAGEVDKYGSQLTGLAEGTAVAVPMIDAHSSAPAIGVTEKGKMMMILGTSACYILLSDKYIAIDGICGYVKDGIVVGTTAYEAGQTGFGDLINWVVKNCVPKHYFEKASELNKSIYEYLDQLASVKKVGENGLLALDWWNGNRTPYADFDVSGMILGLNLNTKPEDIYRAVIEGLAFGAKRIVEIYKDNGINVDEIIASGGIANKNPFIIQILADVIGVKIKVNDSKQSGAKGGAIYASIAGGIYKDVQSASKIIADKCSKEYVPNLINNAIYQKLYNEYVKLSEYFAKHNDVMKKIKQF